MEHETRATYYAMMIDQAGGDAKSSVIASTPDSKPESMDASSSQDVKTSQSSNSRVNSAVDNFLSEYYLSKFSRQIALQYLQRIAASESDEFTRVKAWLLRTFNGLRSLPERADKWQRGCPQIIPKLTARPVWDKADASIFPWVSDLESKFDIILSELESLQNMEKTGFQPYRAPTKTGDGGTSEEVGESATDKGSWNVLYLSLGAVMKFDDNRSRCPKTCEILDSIPGIYGHSFFSCLAPKSHITKHNGPTNKKLRCFLPLLGAGDARLRIGDSHVKLKRGEVLIWDDSFQHESWNDASSSRTTLIFDIWHPETTPGERKFLEYLGNAQLRAQKKMIEASGNEDNFFSIIDRAQYLDVSKDELWTKS